MPLGPTSGTTEKGAQEEGNGSQNFGHQHADHDQYRIDNHQDCRQDVEDTLEQEGGRSSPTDLFGRGVKQGGDRVYHKGRHLEFDSGNPGDKGKDEAKNQVNGVGVSPRFGSIHCRRRGVWRWCGSFVGVVLS